MKKKKKMFPWVAKITWLIWNLQKLAIESIKVDPFNPLQCLAQSKCSECFDEIKSPGVVVVGVCGGADDFPVKGRMPQSLDQTCWRRGGAAWTAVNRHDAETKRAGLSPSSRRPGPSPGCSPPALPAPCATNTAASRRKAWPRDYAHSGPRRRKREDVSFIAARRRPGDRGRNCHSNGCGLKS